MRTLRLVGLGDDGAHVVLEGSAGERYQLAVDERLRAACRGDLTRLGQIEIELGSPLRPREIQSRVRAGESAEQVAAASGVPVDRVLRFAYPVLAERERVAAQARATPVRPGGPTLASLIDERLIGRGTDADSVGWDAWRREDGTWTVRLGWRNAQAHAASWTYHLARRTLQPDDPAAEQLVAEEFQLPTITPVTPLAAAARHSGAPGPAGAAGRPDAPTGATGRGDPAGAGGRGRSAGLSEPAGPTTPTGRGGAAGPSGSVGLGGPAARGGAVRRPPGTDPASGPASRARRPLPGPPAVSDGPRPPGASNGPPAAVPERPARPTAPGGPGQPTEDTPRFRPRGVRVGGPEPDQSREPISAPAAEADVDGDPDSEEHGRRASVPSWDDILLGVRRQQH